MDAQEKEDIEWGHYVAERNNIDQELTKIKLWYYENWPLCLFCNHNVRKGDLAHLIRRSASTRLQTLKLNTGLAHRECHDIFDNKPGEAVYLPRFYECMFLIWRIDLAYHGILSYHYETLGIILPDFFNIDPQIPTIEHHGQLLTLLPLLASQDQVLPLHSGLPSQPEPQADHSQRYPGPVLDLPTVS